MGGCLGTRRPRMNHGRSAVNDNLSDISSRRSSGMFPKIQTKAHLVNVC